MAAVPCRSADERVLALITAAPHALDCAEIARTFGWTRRWALLVLSRLVTEGLLVTTPGMSGGGRPPALFTLPGRRLSALSLPEWVSEHTVVVTPRNLEARILRVLARGYVDLELLGATRHEPALLTLHWSMLAPFQPGRARPEPVRITAATA